MNEWTRFFEGWTGKSRIGAYLEDEKWSLTARLIRAALVFLTLAPLIVMASAMTGGLILNPRNIARIGPQSMTIIMAAAAMVFLFAQGSIDFSFMPVAALSSAIFVTLLQNGVPMAGAICAAIGAAVLVGILNGLLAGFVRLPGLVVTIVTGILAQALARITLHDQTVALRLDGGVGNPMGFFYALNWIVALALFALASLAAYVPAFRKKLAPAPEEGFAAGSLRFGLPYVVSALVAGLTGVFFAFRLQAATPAFGSSGQHEILFVLFFSGAIFGSRAGNPVAVFFAAVYLAILNNLNSLLGMNVGVQTLIVTASAVTAILYNLCYEALASFLYRRKRAKVASAAG